MPKRDPEDVPKSIEERDVDEKVEPAPNPAEPSYRRRSLAPKAKPRSPVMMVAAAAAVVVIGSAIYAAVFRPAEVSHPAPDPAAADLRRRAFSACEAKQWSDCLARFDDAKRIDPAGDEEATVKAARREATRALEGK